MKRSILFALSTLMIMTAAPAWAQEARTQEAGRLSLTLDVGAETGQVMIALFDSETAFDEGGRPVRVASVDVAAGERAVVIEGLTPGAYGFKAFHDVNGNGQMDTNPFGMPVEPYGFSNNAVGNMGPAKWVRAHFEVSGDTAQTLKLN